MKIIKKEIETIETLTAKINAIKNGRTLNQLKADDKNSYYRVQGLSSKRSKLKAEAEGQFITKEHLTEYKGLIIWLLKNKTNFRGHMNVIESMKAILRRVENEKIVFKTKRGIKGIISSITIEEGLNNAEHNLREAYGLDILTHNTLNSKLLSDFAQFRLNNLA